MLRFPHNLSDSQIDLMLLIVLPVMGGAIWLYNAYRMGKLKWKPKGAASPLLVSLAVLAGIVLGAALLAILG